LSDLSKDPKGRRAVEIIRGCVLAIAAALALSGCVSWSSSDVKRPEGAAQQTRAATLPSNVMILDGDVTERPYETLGEIDVTVNKTTLFPPDPTREMVNLKLREEAAKMGADAVIQVRYGMVGTGNLSWGSLDGKGRAIAYKQN